MSEVTKVSLEERLHAEIRDTFADPIRLPPEFKDWIIKWVESQLKLEKHQLPPQSALGVPVFYFGSASDERDVTTVDDTIVTNVQGGTYLLIYGGLLHAHNPAL